MRQFTVSDLQEILRQCAGEPTQPFDEAPDLSFEHLGYDSVALLEAHGHIERDFGVALCDDEAVDLTTPRELVDLVNALRGAERPAGAVEGPVLVLGGTGRQGGAVARELLRRGHTVHALVRDPDKEAARALGRAGAVLVRGDLDDEASLDGAMTGVHGVFSVQTFRGPGGVEAEERQGRAVADAAVRAGVRHFVYSSVGGADRDTRVPHFESKNRVEAHLRSLDLPTTVLRPVMFHDILLDIAPRPADGELVLAMWLDPATPVQLIATSDIGVFAADAFENPGDWLGRVVEIAGDSLTGPQMAAAFEGACGIPTRFQQLPIEPLRAARPDLANMFDWFERDGYRADLAQLRDTRPDLVTLESWLTENWTAPVPVAP
ncbi:MULTISPECIES: NmrA family NAD(P)-binding protein [unclassified Streptomyces]|uniref:NmrA family NAD(P)-binding protein n=1 Tax=unclassified Streptomyces TaxID=2593676 RepID=UPI003BB74945